MSLAYQIYPRETKTKGTVYDIVFRIETANGIKQKKLSGFANSKQAKKAYEEFITQYIATPKVTNDKTALPYQYALSQYLNYLKANLKESTVYDITCAFKMHISPYFENLDLSSITSQDIYQWQDMLWSKTKANGKPYSVARLKTIRTFFRSFVSWCHKRYSINDFFADVETPRRKNQKREYVIWTKEQFMQFYDDLTQENHKAIFYTLFFSGLRLGELQALEPSDFDGNSLSITKNFTRKTFDKSHKIVSIKNYKPHKVPLPDHAIGVLNNWIKYKQDNNIANNYLFVGEFPISERAIRSALYTHAKNVGLPQIRVHDLRHSYVSMLVSNGANFAVIANLIGDTIEQVIKTYSHLTKSDLINAINML